MSSGREVGPRSTKRGTALPNHSEFVAFFFRAHQSASSHPTNPVDLDLQKGVNEVREAHGAVGVRPFFLFHIS